MSRYARRVDANHREVADALESLGCSVLSLAPLGNDAPDLLFGLGGRDHKIEVKDGSKPPSARQRTPGQLLWAERWRGSPTHLVESVQQAVELVNLLRMGKS